MLRCRWCREWADHLVSGVVEDVPAAVVLLWALSHPSVPVRPNLVSVYLPPAVLLKLLPEIAARVCNELWLNPGAESPEVLSEAERLGLNVVQACSIVGVGLSPSQL
jgi:hypothetical protein